ncbi:nitroreductase family protein [Mariannaea sp. PMI_226]|nr:nitroreductase family protein [Mariannaea sp. PMI_226]
MSTSNFTGSQWLKAAENRRSEYKLASTSHIDDKQVEDILRQVLSFAPSAYNSQPVRITLITAAKHKQLWDTIIALAEPILKTIGAEVWDAMKGKLEAHKGAYGSILFWERGQTIQESAARHKAVSLQTLGEWAEHSNGMHQILTWTALSLEGLGANLQHMNAMPPVENMIKDFCGVDSDYKLKAHLNYGDLVGEESQKKPKLPLSETLTVLK